MLIYTITTHRAPLYCKFLVTLLYSIKSEMSNEWRSIEFKVLRIFVMEKNRQWFEKKIAWTATPLSSPIRRSLYFPVTWIMKFTISLLLHILISNSVKHYINRPTCDLWVFKKSLAFLGITKQIIISSNRVKGN